MSKIKHDIKVEDIELNILVEGRVEDLKYLYTQFEQSDGEEQKNNLKELNEKAKSIYELTNIMLKNEYKKIEE
jgi:hypothetical protein